MEEKDKVSNISKSSRKEEKSVINCCTISTSPSSSSTSSTPLKSKSIEGVVRREEGVSTPETGSQTVEGEFRLTGKTSNPVTSVDSQTPDIPNVVEYHLKVKPQIKRDLATSKVSFFFFDLFRVP